ncbi:Gar1/Naf1 RNA binding region-domain-containing protein [Rhodofomes roseus]|uniref:H/ACA ribonucleoprotein complex subunit n=1 Tax=Rhodofomes roseus TaxID=34475 RepID=A0ABQ8K2F3_9APHY|nr:Gar1/Naf1 RNA binding region-domain-containing protein [Rhodofomes roseus]KAH9830945.1 Gar1/Naf1 RNA binding region-domain-containing protein [Rhodofomes roseus]
MSRGGRGGGFGGRGFGGRGGGRGGYGQRDVGPPDTVLEMGSFLHAVEEEMLCQSVMPDKVPYFNAPIYLANKSVIGKVDEILGPINEVYFSVKMEQGMVASSFKKGDKVFIGGDKLLPVERFLPKPKIAGVTSTHNISPRILHRADDLCRTRSWGTRRRRWTRTRRTRRTGWLFTRRPQRRRTGRLPTKRWVQRRPRWWSRWAKSGAWWWLRWRRLWRWWFWRWRRTRRQGWFPWFIVSVGTLRVLRFVTVLYVYHSFLLCSVDALRSDVWYMVLYRYRN